MTLLTALANPFYAPPDHALHRWTLPCSALPFGVTTEMNPQRRFMTLLTAFDRSLYVFAGRPCFQHVDLTT
jgi:hypothetical protein